MMWKSDNQRKKVMAELSKMDQSFKKQAIQIREKSLKPLYPMTNEFSKEGRGSVPLLPTTFVIRGGNPNERKKLKNILDMIGDDPAMEKINTISIQRDQEIPVKFESVNTIVVDEKVLSDSEYNLGVMLLAMSYRMRYPEKEEGYEYAYAKEVVEPRIREKLRKELAKKESAQTEVYQVGAEVQPQYEVQKYEGAEPFGPMEVKVTQVQPQQQEHIPTEDLAIGAKPPEQFKSEMEDKLKHDPFTGGAFVQS